VNKEVRVAVASRSFSRHAVLRGELLERHPRVTFNDAGETLSGSKLIDFLRGHEKAITALERLDASLFAALPELRVVSKYGVGLDMVDLEAMEKAGVLLGWTGGVNKRSVAELTVAGMIMLLHRAPQAESDVRSGKWRQVKGRQLTGKTIGIIGCGNVGKEVATLLTAFDCRLLSHDILDFPDFYTRHNIIPVDLETLLRRSDIVTLHVPLDRLTRNMLNRERLNMMKEGACLVNMARGNLVDEWTIKEMLENGRLGGAAFDVFSQEPPDDLELLNLPNVIATPHIGGSTEEAILAMGRAAIGGLENGRLPSAIVPPYYWPVSP
jgi:phosphoglycerate dehydrogenase-like enzyme